MHNSRLEVGVEQCCEANSGNRVKAFIVEQGQHSMSFVINATKIEAPRQLRDFSVKQIYKYTFKKSKK